MLTRLWYYALAIGTIAGTIIGVGMFGLPYVALQSGFFVVVLYLMFFGVIVGLSHLMYLEVTMRTRPPHRLTGYVGLYMGNRWKTATFIQGLISLWGTLLIYSIIAAKFLSLLLPLSVHTFLSSSVVGLLDFFSLLLNSPISTSFYSRISNPEMLLGILFFLFCAAIVWKGDEMIGKQELLFTFPMVLLIIIMFFVAFSSPAFPSGVIADIQAENWLLPYGITLFALSGFTAIPLIEHILAPAKKRGMKFNYPFIVLFATLLCSFVYILFVWAVVGTSGQATSQDALSGLRDFMGNDIIVLGALLGIFAIYTSFISTGIELQKTFQEDYRIRKNLAFLGALGIPFLLYLINIQNFITLANFVGALMGGYVGAIMVYLFWKAQKEGTLHPPFSLHISRPVGALLMIIFIVASLYALMDTIPTLFHTPPTN